MLKRLLDRLFTPHRHRCPDCLKEWGCHLCLRPLRRETLCNECLAKESQGVGF